MLPMPPNVAPTISLELDVDDGEVENYEVRQNAAVLPVMLLHDAAETNKMNCACLCETGAVEPRRASRRGQASRSDQGRHRTASIIQV